MRKEIDAIIDGKAFIMPTHSTNDCLVYIYDRFKHTPADIADLLDKIRALPYVLRAITDGALYTCTIHLCTYITDQFKLERYVAADRLRLEGYVAANRDKIIHVRQRLGLDESVPLERIAVEMIKFE